MIRDAKVSRDGCFLATISDDKLLRLFRLDRGSLTLAPACEPREVFKRGTTVGFVHATKEPHGATCVLLADKAGDVYGYAVPECQLIQEFGPGRGTAHVAAGSGANDDDDDESVTPLLGHLSYVTDLLVSVDNQHVLTADRDEKIRVSCLPRSFVVEAFCLGHSDFVTRLALLPNAPELLLSGAGDGRLLLWSYRTGACLASVLAESGAECAPPAMHNMADFEPGAFDPTVAHELTPSRMPIVTGLAYVAVNNIPGVLGYCAVLLYDRATVHLFAVTEGVDASSPSLRHAHALTLDATPLSLAWVDECTLLVSLFTTSGHAQPLLLQAALDARAGTLTLAPATGLAAYADTHMRQARAAGVRLDTIGLPSAPVDEVNKRDYKKRPRADDAASVEPASKRPKGNE